MDLRRRGRWRTSARHGARDSNGVVIGPAATSVVARAGDRSIVAASVGNRTDVRLVAAIVAVAAITLTCVDRVRAVCFPSPRSIDSHSCSPTRHRPLASRCDRERRTS